MGGRYRLIERIGIGGMSVVWRGHDDVLERPVAVKVLASGFANHEEFRERIRREARAAARLGHPNVGTVYDFGGYGEGTADGEVPYLVMELIEGPTLASMVTAEPLPARRAVAVCAQVAAALAASHARGLVHRDVKPANVILAPNGAKLVDFGISAVSGEQADDASTGQMLGTPGYVAPERLTGSPARPASDVYALGLLLYRTLAGRLPWTAESRTEMLRAHLHTDPAPLPEIPGLPPRVASICAQCLLKDPAKRPTSAQVAEVLASAAGIRVARTEPVDDPPTMAMSAPLVPAAEAGEPERPSPTIAVPVAAMASAALAAAGTVGMAAGTLAASLRSRVPFGSTRKRVLFAATALAIVGFVLVALLLPGAHGSGGTHRLGGGPADAAIGAEQISCQVTYQVRIDDGGTFTGNLTIRNTGQSQIPTWNLSFALPAQARISGDSSATWAQSGSSVLVRGSTLAAGNSAVLPFWGTYQSASPLPASFSLNETACEPRVVNGAGPVTPATNSSHDPRTPAGTGGSPAPTPSDQPNASAGAGPTGSPTTGPSTPPTGGPTAAPSAAPSRDNADGHGGGSGPSTSLAGT